ncbi:hypothetical protein DH2020_045348 [Rehmannia glutinosa]|uniref:Protein kinase domain-containing protein n=1 Tax=Rehmannia glutinosa TaxID=99300 RepID=A0ABR0UEE4_REHGL
MAGKGKDVFQEKGVNEYGDGVAWIRGPMLGKGSFGRVYLATLKNPTSQYSCFPSVMAVKSAEVSVSGTIQKEKEVMSNLNVCPYLIKCFGEETTMGENGVMAYNLLLEYGSGGTLADRIKKSGSNGLPELEVKMHTRSILSGLNHIHDLGYVHCDVKPDNILLVRNAESGGITEFRAKIGDFGLAKKEKQSKKRKLEPCWRGTLRYLSPEAVIDYVQEAPCDVWAIGCIVLEMLTGKPPWEGEKTEDILAKIRAGNELPKIPNEISNEARDFLKCCFVRKSIYRLNCEMLLNHPFIEDLDSDDLYKSDDDLSDDLFAYELDDGSEDDSSSYWCEEDADSMDDEPGCSSAEVVDIEGVMGSSTNANFEQSCILKRR